MTDVARRRRHLDELCAMCAKGDLDRAIGLAFEHFATDGRDDAALAVLRAAVEGCDPTGKLRTRLGELEGLAE